MTTAQAVLRLEKEAERLRAAGHWTAAHDWQRRANELASLAGMAASLPPARAKRSR